MNYAIRSGIAITSTYALDQCSRLLKSVKGDEREELSRLRKRFDGKIRILSPAIDMIELISARGNSSLESALTLTKALRADIATLGLRLASAATAEELSRRDRSKNKNRVIKDGEVQRIIGDIRGLLERIEDAVPLINLAITTSGANLSTNLPVTISPSRLLQASTFLTAGDTQYSMSSPRQPQQIGPTFVLSLYMLFSGHAGRQPNEEGSVREATWKEVLHKAQLRLFRIPLLSDGSPDEHIAIGSEIDEFAYELQLVEDLDDDRYHSMEDSEDDRPDHRDGGRSTGIHDVLPIYQISKIFYADTGKILNIGSEGEINSPVLLLKRDLNAIPPRRMMETMDEELDLAKDDWKQYDDDDDDDDDEDDANTADDEQQAEIDAQISREDSMPAMPGSGSGAPEIPLIQQTPVRHPCLPADLDQEWLAFEVYTQEDESEPDDSELDHDAHSDVESLASSPGLCGPHESNLEPAFTTALSLLNLDECKISERSIPASSPPATSHQLGGPVRTSLSLLETLIRLTSLQQFQQSSHLSITDELLNFFLSESSTTGAGHDGEERRRKRWEARQRLGFDPYDDSPVKRHGERDTPGSDTVGTGDYHHNEDTHARRSYSDDFPSSLQPFDGVSSAIPSPMLLPTGRHLTPGSAAYSSPPNIHGASILSRSQPLSRPQALSRPQPKHSTRHPSQYDSSPPSRHTNKLISPTTPARSSPLGASPDRRGYRPRRSHDRVLPLSPPSKGRGRGRSVETDSSLGTSPGYEPGLGMIPSDEKRESHDGISVSGAKK